MLQKQISMLVLVIGICALVSACKPAENAAAPAALPDENPTQPLKFQALNVGREANSDGSALPQTLFSPQDRIIASIQTYNAAKDVPLGVKLIAMSDGRVVNESSRKVTTNGMASTTFEFPSNGPWPLGRYVIEAYIGGKVQARQEIDVRDDGPPRPSDEATKEKATEATNEKAKED